MYTKKNFMEKTEKDVTLSTRVPSALAAKVDLLSEQYNRSRSWLVQEALSHYVANELQFIAAVQKGLDDIKAGRVVDHEEVMADFGRFKTRHGIE
jgi:predicted transcriptional regulator